MSGFRAQRLGLVEYHTNLAKERLQTARVVLQDAATELAAALQLGGEPWEDDVLLQAAVDCRSQMSHIGLQLDLLPTPEVKLPYSPCAVCPCGVLRSSCDYHKEDT